MKSILAIAMVMVLIGNPLTAAGQEKVSVATMPPVVVKTEPQSGDIKVDPKMKEIRVTFSKKMMDKSMSWSTVSEDTTAESTGEPKYLADGKTCVLPVKLQPKKTYAFWLNSQ